MAVIPWTPAAANAFRSAWMPAPPPESEPAIESTRGVWSCVSGKNRMLVLGIGGLQGRPGVGADRRAIKVAGELEPRLCGNRFGAAPSELRPSPLAPAAVSLEGREELPEIPVERRPDAAGGPVPGAIQRIQHILGVADEDGPGRQQVVGAARHAGVDRAG